MASMTRHEDKRGVYWRVRWREGAKGRRGKSREFKTYRHGDAKEKLKEVERIEERRTAGLPGGDSTWLMSRFFEEKFLALRAGTVTSGTVGSWKRRWAPTKMTPRPWHVGQAWGNYQLGEITPEAVLTWHAKMRKAGAPAATMLRAHDLLVNILSFAVEMKYLTVHPALGMAPDYEPPRVIDHWRPDTIEAIRSHLIAKGANDRSDWRWRRDRDSVLIAVLGYLGLRPGEALALTWRNVLERDRFLWVTHTIPGLDDEDEQTILNGRTKTRRDRWVPYNIAPFVETILLDWKLRVGAHELDSPVFPMHEGGEQPWTYNAWINWRRGVWVPTLEAIGVTYRKPYHLRHSAVTMWIYTGMPINTVAKRAGHTMQVCMDTYAGSWDTYDEDVDGRYDIEAAYKAARRAATPLRLVQSSSVS